MRAADEVTDELLATTTRRFFRLFALQVALFFMGQVLTPSDMIGSPSPLPTSPRVATVLLTASLLLAPGLAYVGWHLHQRVGGSHAWFVALGLVLPCFGFLVALELGERATRTCRQRGLAIGFLGPRNRT